MRAVTGRANLSHVPVAAACIRVWSTGVRIACLSDLEPATRLFDGPDTRYRSGSFLLLLRRLLPSSEQQSDDEHESA